MAIKKPSINLAGIFDFENCLRTMSAAGDAEWGKRLKILRVLIKHERLPVRPDGRRYSPDELISMPLGLLTTAAREVLGTAAPAEELKCLSAGPVDLAKIFNADNAKQHPKTKSKNK